MTVRSKSGLAGTLATLVALAGAGSAVSGPERAQAVPRETAQPKIIAIGFLMEGTSLKTDNGRWSNNPTTFRYQWQRCTRNDDETCTNIDRADGIAYTIRPEDVGNRLRIFVTACNNDGCSRPANSRITGVVQARAAPRNTRAPTVSGPAVVGQTLTGEPGAWANGVVDFDFTWQRCDGAGANCATIGGARSRTYGLTPADLGRRLRFVVRAQNNRGSATAVSAPTEAVREAGPAGGVTLPTGETSVPVTSVSLPERLLISRVTFSPSPLRSRSEPITIRVRVIDTRNFVVRDALVFVRSTPLVTSTPPEGVTQQDGWATFQVLPQSDLRLFFRRGYNLQFFVRARKSGDRPLAGISTSRLVQVRIFPR